MAKASYDFSDKNILITGGGGDIGRATALRLANAGATILLLDNVQEKADAVAKEINNSGGKAKTYIADVTNDTEVNKSIEHMENDLGLQDQKGQIHMLFNNAGYQGLFTTTDTYPSEDFQKVIDVNITGVFHVLKAVATHMREHSGGAIVNTASYAGVSGPPNMLAYAASKFAVVGMTETAAKDLAPFNIRVNAISPSLIGPGFMWTRQTELQAATNTQYFDSNPKVVEKDMVNTVPMRRYGSLEEVANGVAFLLSDEASYITGFNLVLNGGQG